jgi:D-xylose transport system substrate-binding protein
VMINGAPTDSNSKPYKDGATEVLEQRGAKIVKSFDTPDWSPDKAQQQMEQSITSLGKDGFDAVYSANDGMAGGAIAALKGANIDPSTKYVTGQDAELAGIQRILVGEQLMTVYQPIIDIAETAAEMAVPIAQGEDPGADVAPDKVDNGAKQVPSKLLDTIAITPENIQDTVVKEGFLEPSEICTGPYADACKEFGVQ